MPKHGNDNVTKQISKARKLFAEMLKTETSATGLTSDWLIEAYKLIDEHYVTEKKNGKKVGKFIDPIKTVIKPFEKKTRNNKLLFTPLVQMLQMDKPAKMSPEFNSRNYKYSAALTIAHIKGWKAKDFPIELKKEGGLTRLVKLYSKHINKENGSDAVTTYTRDIKYFEKREEKDVLKTLKPLPEEYVEKVVIARTHKKGIEILRPFPADGKLTYPKK